MVRSNIQEIFDYSHRKDVKQQPRSNQPDIRTCRPKTANGPRLTIEERAPRKQDQKPNTLKKNKKKNRY